MLLPEKGMALMSAKVTPPPDRFAIRRAGEPDRLAPPIAVPTTPETERAPIPAAPAPPREPVPAT